MKLLTALSFVALVGATNGQANSIITQARTDNALFNYLMQSSASLTNPVVSGECFTRHLPMLSKIAQKFSVQYQACITLATNRTANLALQAMQSRDAFVQDITTMCSAYQSCAHEKEVLDFFNCYASVSSQDVDLIFNITHKVTFAASSYSRNLQQIQEDSVKCTNASERAYISDTAATYKQLDNCLQHGLSEDETSTTETVACVEPDATEAPATERTDKENKDKENVNEDLALKYMFQAMIPKCIKTVK